MHFIMIIMHHSNIYSLSVAIHAITGQALPPNQPVTLVISHEWQQKVVRSEAVREGRAIFNKTAHFQFEEGSINRESRLVFTIIDETDQKGQLFAKFDTLIMDSRTYSQKIFITHGENSKQFTVEMRMTMGSLSHPPLSNTVINSVPETSKHKSQIRRQLSEKTSASLGQIPHENKIGLGLWSLLEMMNESGASSTKIQLQTRPTQARNYNPISSNQTKTSLDSLFKAFQAVESRLQTIRRKQLELNQSQSQSASIEDRTQSKLQIHHNISVFHVPDACQHSRERSMAKRRYQLVNQTAQRHSNPQIDITETYYGFTEEARLNNINYIKLSKIKHLSEAADIAKRKNEFLLKANEELKTTLEQAEKRLEAAKRLTQQRESLLNQQFKTLKTQFLDLQRDFVLKNEDSSKRDQRIKALQGTVQQYARDINNLKEQLKNSQAIIHSLKSVLAGKEDSELLETNSRATREMKTNRKQSPTSMSEWNFQKETTPKHTIHKANSVDYKIDSARKDESSEMSGLKVFRKFSHSKNASYDINEPKKTGRESTTDIIFDKLALLCMGSSSNRLLRNL